jgi:tetratricopeptide (TPR) repeat protein
MVLRSTAFRTFILIAGLMVAPLALAPKAMAQVTVFSGADSQATACSLAARHGNATPETLHVCNLALEHEALFGRDLAGTYVNRGVLYLRMEAWDRARADFEEALAIYPTMGEALVNRGAVRIHDRHLKEGVADIDLGLTYNPQQPERAYYNRALAKERLDDVKGAYFDFLKASELAPNWTPPQEELKRYTVARRNAG